MWWRCIIGDRSNQTRATVSVITAGSREERIRGRHDGEMRPSRAGENTESRENLTSNRVLVCSVTWLGSVGDSDTIRYRGLTQF